MVSYCAKELHNPTCWSRTIVYPVVGLNDIPCSIASPKSGTFRLSTILQPTVSTAEDDYLDDYS